MEYRENPVMPIDPRAFNPPGMHIWGYMDPYEMQWLFHMAQQMNSICQIGCLYGRSAYTLLTACKGPVYCIDMNMDGDYPFKLNCGHFPNVRMIDGYSSSVVHQVPIVDMVFIDGSHTYEDMKLDLELYLPLARKLICGHDYNLISCPGVRQAVDEFFGGPVASFMSPFKDFGETCGDRGNIWMKWIE